MFLNPCNPLISDSDKVSPYAHGQKIGYNRGYEPTQMHCIQLYQLSNYHNRDTTAKRAKPF